MRKARAEKSLKAILFDFDGVIVDSESLHHRAYEAALAPHGVDGIPFDVYADQFSNRGIGLDYCARRVPGIDVRALKLRKEEIFVDLLRRDVVLLPGAADTLRRLAGHCPLALATGSVREAASWVLRRFDLLDCFCVIVTREDYELEKPQPDAFLQACTSLRVDPASCLVVEDSQKGLRAAGAAGIPCVVVPNAYTRGGDFGQAVAVLDALSDLSPERAEELHAAPCRDDAALSTCRRARRRDR